MSTVKNTIHEGIDDDHEAGSKKRGAGFWALVVGCLGVVYGDIGTSPLYAFREAVHYTVKDGNLLPTDVYGILSLIIWSLTITVTLKYVLILLRIDNRGEGGILSLMALARKINGMWGKFILGAGLLGLGLFYGDAVITPAISVMSAVEGLKLVSPVFDNFILPLTIAIIVILFINQKHGTAKVSKLFGPVTAVWFLVMAAMGTMWIIPHPEILWSFNPYYGAKFLIDHADISLAILGAVFLAVTGAEALYADLGHFGRKPIEYAWLRMVFPCLVLNYLGQGAFVLERGKIVESPFFEMVPSMLLFPLVLLAGFATVIASQAVITGAFSLSRQAVQMGLLPHLEIRHTSADQKGQIYMPQINKWLFYVVIILCFTFGSSSEMASAYGIAVIGTMIVSTLLVSFVMWKILKRSMIFVVGFLVLFLVFEGAFFSANMMKVFHGGFVPLAMAAMVFLAIRVWMRGTRYLHKRAHRNAILLSDLMEQLERNPPAIVEGTAIYLTSDPFTAPMSMLQNLKHNKVLHSKNIVLSVVTSQFPKVPESQRVTVERVSSSMTRVYVHYGFMEISDVPAALVLAKAQGLDVDLKNVSYFIGHRTVVGHPNHGLPVWQEKIFIALARSAASATDFYRLPINRVVELGIQMTI